MPVKAECRVHSDTEVFDTIGICYWLVVNDDRPPIIVVNDDRPPVVVSQVLVCCSVVKGNVLFLF